MANLSRLDAMPEFEREAILAQRQEDMQKYKDSQQLDAMYRMAGMGGEEEESEEEPSRKKRTSIIQKLYGGNSEAEPAGKHTSVSKEASRAMKDLKNKRKAKDERDARRVGSLPSRVLRGADGPGATPRSPSTVGRRKLLRFRRGWRDLSLANQPRSARRPRVLA
jgi:hypothetical protein